MTSVSDRRKFLFRAAAVTAACGHPAWLVSVIRHALSDYSAVRGSTKPGPVGHPESRTASQLEQATQEQTVRDQLTLFLSGDVMTGRGIDQAFPHSVDPRLYEPYVRDARHYVELAEEESGPLPQPLDYAYIWGDALNELEREAPDARIINLETAVTTSGNPWRAKQVHYRMHPANVPCLAAARIDCCVLANNHVLDWGIAGLEETLKTLEDAGIQTVGAGRDQASAARPVVLVAGNGRRILVFGFGDSSSGIPAPWSATESRPGVNLLPDLSARTARRVAEAVHRVRREGDLVVASIHWGSNWGYGVPREQREFAHRLVDEAAVDIVHGHSSHHPKGIEVYRDRPILYGCGDLLNDYEGIDGHERFRGELGLMYFPTLDPNDGGLIRFRMSPMRMRRFRLQRASEEETAWLRATLSREAEAFGTGVESSMDGILELRWRQDR